MPRKTHSSGPSGRSLPVVLSLLVAMATTTVDTRAQSGSGRVVRPHWPDMIYETMGAMDVPFTRSAEQYGDLDLLPGIDSLILDFAWDIDGDRPRMAFDLSWVPGPAGVLDGRPVPGSELPDSIVMRLIDLQAQVFVDGDRVGDLVLALDSLGLPPEPYMYSFETASSSWDSLFAGMSGVAARAALEKGFELRNLDVLRIAFDGFEFERASEREVRVVHRVPRRRTIFVPDPGIWIGWDLGPDPYRAQPRRPGGAVRPRGTDSGRDTSAGRSTTRRGSDRNAEASDEDRRSGLRDLLSGNSGKNDDDDDDDRDLLGPALAGAAAVGMLAVLGGSVGLSGWSDAPYGLSGGRMTARSGWLVHGSVNEDVISGGGGEVFRFGVTGFMRPMAGAFMPGFGLGTRTSEASGVTRSDITVEVAGAVRFGRVFLLGGVDVVTATGRFGVILAIRDPDRR